jgi:hypothetical protein
MYLFTGVLSHFDECLPALCISVFELVSAFKTPRIRHLQGECHGAVVPTLKIELKSREKKEKMRTTKRPLGVELTLEIICFSHYWSHVI